MPDLDEYLRNELRRTIKPVDVNDLSSTIEVRRARRGRVRKVQSIALTVVVLAGTIGGVAVLSNVFRKSSPDSIGDASPFPIVPKANGVIVAAQQTRGGPLQLVSVDPDGSGRTVIETRATGDPWLPAWSPDGTRLAVAMFPDPEPRAIWIMDADGANAVKIAEGDNVSRPSWSPDGNEIAYAVDTPQGSSIHIISADGTGDRVIGETIQGKDYFSVSFSPDGTQLVFDKGTDSGFGIFVMNVDGTDVRRISSGTSDYNPSWSPDGTRIVFTRQEEGAESDVYVMDADGSNVNRLTNDGPGVTNLYAEWSPDGKRIAYLAGVTGGPGSLVVMDADGSDPSTIVDGGVIGISWQPLSITSGSPSMSPTPTISGPVDLGLGFPVCSVHMQQGDFNGDRAEDTAYLATKMSDVGDCSDRGTAFEVLAIDVTGDGQADTSYGPLECPSGCRPFAAPDVDGDGTDELAVVVGGYGSGSLVAFELYRYFEGDNPSRSRIAPIGTVEDAGGLSRGLWFWGSSNGSPVDRYGAYCLRPNSPDARSTFVSWNWQRKALSKKAYLGRGRYRFTPDGNLRFVRYSQQSIPSDDLTQLPPGGGSAFCGAIVRL